MTNDDATRFSLSYIPEPNSGCWIWTAAISAKGYGLFWSGTKMQRAHRASWLLFIGKIPDGVLVLHRCDTRCCVNPDHLFLGSHQDNVNDRVSKGRSARGEKAQASLLKENDIKSIRDDIRKHSEIAADYGVSDKTIQAIKKRRNWAWVE